MTVKKTKSRVQIKCPECEHVFLPSLEEVQSRAGKSSRRKGANFERKVAKDFAKWWPGNYEFKRTPMSGGSALKVGFDMAGDICTNAPDFNYHLELKNAPGSFTGLHNLFSDKSAIWKWMEQAVTDGPLHKMPILIMNRFDMPTFCMCLNNDKINFIMAHTYLKHLRFRVGSACEYVVWLLNDMLTSNPEEWK